MRINESIIHQMKPEHQLYVYKLLEMIEQSEVDVLALVIYGSSITRSTYPTSDVDSFFLTDDPKGHQLNHTVVVKGVGYDGFCIDSQRIEQIVHLQEDLLPLIADSVCVYVKNEQVKQRMLDYRIKALQLLSGSDCLDQALVRHRKLMELKRQELVNLEHRSDILMTFQSWLYHFACHIAYQHHRYLPSGVKSMQPILEECLKDDALVCLILQVVYSKEGVKQAVLDFITYLDQEADQSLEIKFVEESPSNQSMTHDEIKEYYQELVSYFRKVEHASTINDEFLFFNQLCMLQRELNVLLPAMKLDKVDFLSKLAKNELSTLIEDVLSIEQQMNKWFHVNQIVLDEYESFAQWQPC